MKRHLPLCITRVLLNFLVEPHRFSECARLTALPLQRWRFLVGFSNFVRIVSWCGLFFDYFVAFNRAILSYYTWMVC